MTGVHAEGSSKQPDQRYDRDSALAFSQSVLNKATDGAYRFLDSGRQPRSLTEYRGRPLVVSLIFTSCHHVCPTLTENLAEVVRVARKALGNESFNVISIGFDTAVDSPERMHLYARERNIDIPGWDFLSADEKTIRALTRELGFIYFPTPRGFDHLSQVTLLDGEGRVYRQIYGTSFEAPALVEPLKELVFGKRSNAGLMTSLVNNVRLFCTIYDPRTGRYAFDYSIFIGFTMGILVLGGIALFILREWRQHRRGKPC